MDARIGTSGWQYPHFKGRFYPESLPSAEQLHYYSERLKATEVNRTFYHFSRASTYAKWRATTAPGFEIAIKAHGSFTHDHPFGVGAEEDRLPELLTNTAELGEKLGPLLFQFPPSLEVDRTALSLFLKRLPRDRRYCFELRHPSWHEASIYRLLEKHGAAFCIFDIRAKLSPIEVTAPFAYVRLHGPLPQPYRGAYPAETLAEWAERLRDWKRQKLDVYVFFDNTMFGDAIDDARKLVAAVEDGKKLKAG